MVEQEAISRLRQGSPEGLPTLVDAYQVRALRLAYMVLGNRADADDVVADAFIVAYDRIHQLRDSSQFEPWFMRIVTNRALACLRRSHRTRRITTVLGGRLALHPQLDPQALAEDRQENRALWDAIGSRPPSERVVIVLRYGLDLDEKTIARRMGSPVGTVKTRLRRARQRLQRKLAPLLNAAAAAGTT
jgi:RNA polymerase sigma-70 factor, ECF subfamily